MKEIDWLVAEKVMDWTPNIEKEDGLRYCYWRDSDGFWRNQGIRYNIPFSSDMSMAYLMEETIAKKGLITKYVDALMDIVKNDFESDGDLYSMLSYGAYWMLIHASPEWRCRAALKAVGMTEKELDRIDLDSERDVFDGTC